MPLLSILITNYNTKDLLKRCLDNLLPMNLDKEIIVVDNSSYDGSFEMLTSEYLGKVTTIKSENKGLAVAYNKSLKASTGKYLLYVGTDAYPTFEAINDCIKYAESHPGAGIITARLVLRDGKPDMDAHRGFPTPLASLFYFSKLSKLKPNSPVFNAYFLGGRDLHSVHEIDVCISHFMFIRKDLHDKVGLWDENYFLYGEDVDFCYRVKQAGYKNMYLGNVEVLHYKGGGVTRKSTSDIKNASKTSDVVLRRIPMETTRAMRLFYETHYKAIYPGWVNAIVLTGIMFMDRLRALKAYLVYTFKYRGK